MEWSVPDRQERYKASLQESEGSVSVASITRDGTEVNIPETAVEAEGRPGRVIVTVGGEAKLAHVTRTGDTWWVHMDGRAHEVLFHEQGGRATSNEGSLGAPMPGTVLEVLAREGQRVREGQHLMTLEAMKMELALKAPYAGTVTVVDATVGRQVPLGHVLFHVEPTGSE